MFEAIAIGLIGLIGFIIGAVWAIKATSDMIIGGINKHGSFTHNGKTYIKKEDNKNE